MGSYEEATAEKLRCHDLPSGNNICKLLINKVFINHYRRANQRR
jgi:hypothetical protein